MKIKKNFIVLLALMAMLPMQVFAQKRENNVICDNEECVLAILDKLNSQNPAVVDEGRKEINDVVENVVYTLDVKEKTALKKSILLFVENNDKCSSNDYLFSLFPRFCYTTDVVDLYPWIDNDNHGDAAIRAIGDIPETGDYISKYIIKNHDNLKHKAALAYAVGKQNVVQMENELISWLDDADLSTKIEIYNALVVVRTNEKTTKIVEKGAKKLYNSKDVPTKIEGMKLLTAVKGEKSLSMLYKSLKNKDKRVQVAALDLLKPFANDKVCAKTVKICSKNGAVVEVLGWLGEIKNDSQMEFVINQLSSQDPKVVEAAIRAVFNIDNPNGIAAVKPMFGGKYQEVIKEEMIKYEGDYFSVLNDVIRGNDKQKLAVLQIIEERPILETNRRVRELLNSGNPDVKDEAFKVLKYVVMPANADFLSALLENCDDKYVEDVQIAIKNAMANIPEAPKDDFVIKLKHVKPNIMPRFYKVFAYFGTELSVSKLIEAYESGDYKKQAKEALLLVENEAYKDRIAEVLKH